MSGNREQVQNRQSNGQPEQGQQVNDAPRKGSQPPLRQMAVVLVVASLGLSLAGCGPVGTSSGLENSASDTSNQFVNRSVRGNLLVSKMLPIRLRLRNGWQPAPENILHDSADLQAYNPDADIFLIVLGERRASVVAGSLEEQASRYLQLMKTGMSQTLANESLTEVNSIGSAPAVQYELRGVVLEKPVAYLHTTVQLDENYYQVVVWTPDDLRTANIGEMKAIVQGFGPDQR